MKALVLTEYNKFEIQQMPTPELGEDDVLIEVKACGICGSDVHGMDGSTGRRIPPIVMGHEAAGVIVETGSLVKGWRTGDHVTFDSTVYCGSCWHCRRGEINLCDHRMVLGVSCGEYRRHGAYAEYVAVPQRILYRIPGNVSFERAAMVEPLSIAMHAVSLTPITLNDCVLVVGAGMIGLLVIQAAIAAGCGQLIAVDLESEKLELARQLGASIVLNANECNVADEVKRLTEGRGADVAFEAVGASTSVNVAVHTLRKGGALTLIGNLAPTIEFPLQAVVTRELRVQGSCASRGDYPACLDFISRGRVNLDPVHSASVPLEAGAEWFRRLYNKEKGLMKVILNPT
ncbi:MAG: alcohol dehydrogenase catalytic domain-containing protein [bacterium]|nr:alcohol dehydrogenase catalytic domain-containing protein [bacterium]